MRLIPINTAMGNQHMYSLKPLVGFPISNPTRWAQPTLPNFPFFVGWAVATGADSNEEQVFTPKQAPVKGVA